MHWYQRACYYVYHRSRIANETEKRFRRRLRPREISISAWLRVSKPCLFSESITSIKDDHMTNFVRICTHSCGYLHPNSLKIIILYLLQSEPIVPSPQQHCHWSLNNHLSSPCEIPSLANRNEKEPHHPPEALSSSRSVVRLLITGLTSLRSELLVEAVKLIAHSLTLLVNRHRRALVLPIRERARVINVWTKHSASL